MKLVIATPLYPPEIGGPATYAYILEENLPERGFLVSAVPFSAVRHLPKVVRHIAYGYRLWRAARKHDLVLALDPVSVGLPALAASRLAGKPLVLKIVGDYAWEQGTQRFGVTASLDDFVVTKKIPWRVQMLHRTQTFVARRARRIIVPSAYLKNIIVHWGIPRETIEVIFNAVPPETIGSAPSAVRALMRPLVLTAGRLVPWKHVDDIIRAVAAVPGRSLVIVGDGPERKRLEQLASDEMPGRFLFTGTLSHKDLLATMKEADVFVLNSSYEGLSHVLVEASMLHVPIIATTAGGNPEVVQDGVNGKLIPPNDRAALIDALVSPQPLRGGEREEFTVETMLSKTATLLQQI